MAVQQPIIRPRAADVKVSRVRDLGYDDAWWAGSKSSYSEDIAVCVDSQELWGDPLRWARNVSPVWRGR